MLMVGLRLVFVCAGISCRIASARLQSDSVRIGSNCPRKPLTTPAVAPVEVLAFDPPSNRSDWMQMDWQQITTLALFTPWPPPDDLYCHAHAHNVKIVKCVDFDAADIANATARSTWVTQIVKEAIELGTDGANVDIEGFNGQKEHLNLLIFELASEFRKANPTAQITFDTAVFPANEPLYDYVTLAKYLDFFLPMAYDIVAPPNQLANCPYAALAQSAEGYASYGVQPHQLVYGLPWYGYDFPCTNSTLGSPCKPPCSGNNDNIRKLCPQVTYAQAMACHNAGDCHWAPQSLAKLVSLGADPPSEPRAQGARGPWTLDTVSDTVYFEYINASGVRHQLWYDDEVSLAAKYRHCRSIGARGVAMWEAGSLEYGTLPDAMKRTALMWRTLREFTQAPFTAYV